MPPVVPTRPASGALIDDAWGQWVHDWLKKRDLVRGSSVLTLTTGYVDIPGMTMTLGAGWYMVLATIDFRTDAAGPGALTAQLLVDGVVQAGTAVYQNASSATAGQSTVSQMWLVQITGAGVIKLQAKKSAAPAASVVGTNSALAVL